MPSQRSAAIGCHFNARCIEKLGDGIAHIWALTTQLKGVDLLTIELESVVYADASVERDEIGQVERDECGVDKNLGTGTDHPGLHVVGFEPGE